MMSRLNIPVRCKTVLPMIAALVLAAGSPAHAQRHGGTLVEMLVQEPSTLMLPFDTMNVVELTATKIFQSLVYFDFDSVPHPKLAESWKISEDGLTYTFHLRDDVRWHDGEPFTSEDVVFSLLEFLPDVHPSSGAMLSQIEDAKALDDHTVEITLKTAYAPFMKLFLGSNGPMVPAHIYKGTDYRTNPMNETPIGTGPFKFAEWKRGDHIRLVRNDDYYKEGLPYLDEIIYLVLLDSEQRVIALETGRVHVGNGHAIAESELPQLRDTGKYNELRNGYNIAAPIQLIEFNLRKPPMNDKRFRQAIAHLINRDFIKDNIFNGLGVPTESMIGPSDAYHDPDAITRYDYSLEKATALLDEMGLEPDEDGVRAEVELMMVPFRSGPFVRTPEFFKQEWAQAGIKINLESNDTAGFVKKHGDWDFDMTWDGIWQRTDPAFGVGPRFESSNIKQGVPFSNVMGFTNDRVDEILAAAPAAVDQAERQRLYSEFQKAISDEVPVIPLFEREFSIMLDKRVHNLIVDDITGINNDYETVWMSE